MGKLNTKTEIHDARNRNLVFAIIATFIQRETSVEPYLTSLLRKNGIQILTGEESTSTNDLTTATENILTLRSFVCENSNAASLTQFVTDSLNAPSTVKFLRSEDQAHTNPASKSTENAISLQNIQYHSSTQPRDTHSEAANARPTPMQNAELFSGHFTAPMSPTRDWHNA